MVLDTATMITSLSSDLKTALINEQATNLPREAYCQAIATLMATAIANSVKTFVQEALVTSVVTVTGATTTIPPVPVAGTGTVS